jgi:hypothetical protein
VDGAVPSHGLTDRQARDQEKTHRAGGGKDCHLIAIPIMDDSPVAADATAVKIEIVGPDDLVGIGVPVRVEVTFPGNDVGKGGVASMPRCGCQENP